MQYSEGSKKFGWFGWCFLSKFFSQSFNDAVYTAWFEPSNPTTRKQGYDKNGHAYPYYSHSNKISVTPT